MLVHINNHVDLKIILLENRFMGDLFFKRNLELLRSNWRMPRLLLGVLFLDSQDFYKDRLIINFSLFFWGIIKVYKIFISSLHSFNYPFSISTCSYIFLFYSMFLEICRRRTSMILSYFLLIYSWLYCKFYTIVSRCWLSDRL